jgi:integrase
MMVLTGQRPGKLQHMRWEHIEDSCWAMPGEPDGYLSGTKNKQTHGVWLSWPVKDILEELPMEVAGLRVSWSAWWSCNGLGYPMISTGETTI